MKPYAEVSRLDIGVSCGQGSEKFFEFFAATAMAFASRPEILRFVVAVNNGADRKAFEALNSRFAIDIVEPVIPPMEEIKAHLTAGRIVARSYMHGVVLNALVKSMSSDAAVISDCDIAIVRKGWDEAMYCKLDDKVAIVGSGYPRENQGENIAPKYRNFPNVTFCMLRMDVLRPIQIDFLPGGAVTIDAELAKVLGRKKGESMYLDVGVQLPIKLRRAGLRGLVMPLVWPDEYSAKVLKPRRDWREIIRLFWPHEFHLDGAVTSVHLGKSELRPLGQDKVAIAWEDDVRKYIEAIGCSGFVAT